MLVHLKTLIKLFLSAVYLLHFPPFPGVNSQKIYHCDRETDNDFVIPANIILAPKRFAMVFYLLNQPNSYLVSIPALPHLDMLDSPVNFPPVREIPETFMSGNDKSWLQKYDRG